MKKESFWQRYGAYIAAIVLFVAVACVYCSPSLEGKVVRSGDGISATAAVHESVEYRKNTGDYSFWTGSMFSGMPNYQIGGGHYKANEWLKPFRKIMLKGHNSAPWVFIIYFVCFFLLMRAFNINKWLSIVGALATGFSSYFFIIVAAGLKDLVHRSDIRSGCRILPYLPQTIWMGSSTNHVVYSHRLRQPSSDVVLSVHDDWAILYR